MFSKEKKSEKMVKVWTPCRPQGPRGPRETRDTRGSGSGRVGLDLFRPRGAIGRGPEAS